MPDGDQCLATQGSSLKRRTKSDLRPFGKRGADRNGRVAERFKAMVLKTIEGESLPRVRIPPLPPRSQEKLHLLRNPISAYSGKFLRASKKFAIRIERPALGRQGACWPPPRKGWREGDFDILQSISAVSRRFTAIGPILEATRERLDITHGRLPASSTTLRTGIVSGAWKRQQRLQPGSPGRTRAIGASS